VRDCRPKRNAGGLASFAIILVLGLPAPERASAGAHSSLGGMSGLIHVPTANVVDDGWFHFGHNVIDKEWSYDGRSVIDNRIWFVSIGFIPNLEITARATVLPGQSLIEEVPVDAVDRMLSLRYRVLREGVWPALAIGIDDLKGTRRFHSLYGVATKTVRPLDGPVEFEFSAGYGLRTLEAGHYLLDGGFGGVAVTPVKNLSGIVEYDSEKWSGAVRLTLFRRLDLEAALLNFDTASGGLSFRQHF
jgi:hypothetical protein